MATSEKNSLDIEKEYKKVFLLHGTQFGRAKDSGVLWWCLDYKVQDLTLYPEDNKFIMAAIKFK